jgi:hypothetical protein
MHKEHTSACSVTLEVVADYDLWIWHILFDMEGSHNVINVLQRSPVFVILTKGHSPSINYVINGHTYTKRYYIADNIFPKWSVTMKTISELYLENKVWSAKCQESCKKDVEQAFGVLWQRFGIVRYLALQ